MDHHVDDIQTEVPDLSQHMDEDPVQSSEESVAEPVQEEEEEVPPAPVASKKKRVSKWTSIAKASFGTALERRGDVFVAPLDTPLYIMSPTVTLHSDLYDDDDLNEWATLKLKRAHVETFENLETMLLQAAKNNKAAWFHNPDLSDDFIEKSLKKFVDRDARTIMVKVDEGLGGKTSEALRGTKVKVVLRVDAAVFTRTQFGLLWTIDMVKSIEKNDDMYLFDPEEDPSAEGLVEGDLLSRLAGDSSIDNDL